MMLEGYTKLEDESGDVYVARQKRLLAVQAALEIAKSSVGSTGAGTQSKVAADLKAVSSEINALADAIQEAMK